MEGIPILLYLINDSLARLIFAMVFGTINNVFPQQKRHHSKRKKNRLPVECKIIDSYGKYMHAQIYLLGVIHHPYKF